MPDRNILDDFVTTVVSGRYDEAIERFYTAGARMQENLDPPRAGRDGLVTHERSIMAAFKSIAATCVAPVFVDDDRVVIRWVFTF